MSTSTARSRRAPVTSPFAALRIELDLSRPAFSRLLGFSERAVAGWESGAQAPGEAATRALRQIERIRDGAARVMKAKAVPAWLLAPNEAFGGLKPIELIERGEHDRIWRTLFSIEAGVPL